MANGSKQVATGHHYKIRQLHRTDIDKAYALVHAAYGHPTLTDWHEYVQHHAVGHNEAPDEAQLDRGIVIVENARGYLAGLFCYRVQRKSLGGPSLECDHFILPEVLRADRLFARLLEEAEDLAHKLGCRRLLVALPSTAWQSPATSGRISFALQQLGYRPDRFVIHKDLGTEPANPV